MVSVDGDRVDYEIDLLSELIFKYFDFTANFIFEQNVTEDATDIEYNKLNNIYDEIIDEGFQLGEDGYTFTNFCDNDIRGDLETDQITFFAGNLLDETIEICKYKIKKILLISDNCLENCSKQAIIQLYSCAIVRENKDWWIDYIYTDILEPSIL